MTSCNSAVVVRLNGGGSCGLKAEQLRGANSSVSLCSDAPVSVSCGQQWELSAV